MVCSMIRELLQLYSVLNHNPYNDFEAPPINPQSASSLIGTPSNLKVALSSKSKALLRRWPHLKVLLRLREMRMSCQHSARCVTISHLDLLLLTCHQLP